MNPLGLLYSQPWPPSTAVAPVLAASQLVEEEKTPCYDAQHFYPTQLGEVLKTRYQIARKLGYGINSTVWLARDHFQFVLIHDGIRPPVKIIVDGGAFLNDTLR